MSREVLNHQILMVGGRSRVGGLTCRRREEMMDEGGGGGGDVEEKEEEYKTRRGKQSSAGDRGRAGMVGGLAESGVRTTCFSDFTIVYRHRSTEWPVPYTDGHTPGAHEVIERVKELHSDRKKEGGRKKEREKEGRKETKENTIDKDCTTVRGDLRTFKADEDLHYRFPLDEFTPANDKRTICFACLLSRLFV